MNMNLYKHMAVLFTSAHTLRLVESTIGRWFDKVTNPDAQLVKMIVLQEMFHLPVPFVY